MLKAEALSTLVTKLRTSSSETQIRSEWVGAPCPLAPWKHKHDKDRNASFGVSYKGTENICYCFTCGFNRPLSELLMEIQYLQHNVKAVPGYDLAGAWQIYHEHSYEVPEFDVPDYEEVAQGVEKPVNFGKKWLASFQSAVSSTAGMDHLWERGISVERAQELQLKFDHTGPYVSWPFWDLNGDLVGMRGKYIGNDQTHKRFHDYSVYAGGQQVNNTHLVWFGEWVWKTGMPVILCEGTNDWNWIYEHYPNVLGALTASLSEHKLDKLKMAPAIITFFDNDPAGDKARKKVREHLGGIVPVQDILYPVVPIDRYGRPVGPDNKLDPDSLPSEVMWQCLLQSPRIAEFFSTEIPF